jgi:hypothetical protein
MVNARWRSIGFASLLSLCALHSSENVYADESGASSTKPVRLDRVVAKWRLIEQGAEKRVRERLIFARILAFEARIEAMALGEPPDAKLVDRPIRLALSRHVTEELLQSLPVTPEVEPTEIAKRAELSRRALEIRVGGVERLEAAMQRERIGADELAGLLRRSARASFYLERMVAPLLEPTELELRELHASGKTPFTDKAFDTILEPLKRWVMGQRLTAAVDDFWQQARSRLVIQWVK